jgi:hypothetical protein
LQIIDSGEYVRFDPGTHCREDYPLSDLERELSLDNAKRSLKAVQDVLLRLTEAIPEEDSVGLYSDSWEGSATVIYDE